MYKNFTYKFPHITQLSQVEAAVKGRTDIIIAEREGFVVANYIVSMSDTFPTPNTKSEKINELYRIRRECRGIKFDLKTGKILARPYHKFRNFGETSEVEAQNINFSDPFVILEKLDGSMIHPMFLDGQIVFCTRMGLTDVAWPAEVFARDHKTIQYIDFCKTELNSGFTPIFEWCSRQQRIVIDHPEDKLILTGLRRTEGGQYASYAMMQNFANVYNVPCVNIWQGTFNGIKDFISEVSELENEEGYIIRFGDGSLGAADGHMLKIKNMWYVQIHKAKEAMAWEKDIWALILDNRQDDVMSVLEKEDADKLRAFADDLYKALAKKADELKWVVIAAQDNLNNSKKRFALDIIPKHAKIEKGLLFKIWDGDEATEVVNTYVREHLKTGTRLEEVRPLAGIKWDDYR